VSEGNGTPGKPADPTGPGASGPAAATDPPPVTPPPAPEDGAPSPEEMTVGQLVFEISDRATVLVREEIELAKTEVTEKVNQLLRGGVVAIVAGVFLLAALAMIMHGIAWVLNDLVFDNFWAGFFVEAALFLLIAAGAGLFAYRAFQKASPPTPDMAIEEAKEIKAAFDHEEGS
jgi:uncharacterized membrane protein YqjE